ncbi:MAG: hypothetical protein HRF49_03500 [bacterium]|jgi:hypothetical protein
MGCEIIVKRLAETGNNSVFQYEITLPDLELSGGRKLLASGDGVVVSAKSAVIINRESELAGIIESAGLCPKSTIGKIKELALN